VTPQQSSAAAPATPAREQRGRADKKRTERILKAFHEEERFGKAYDARLTKRLWGYLMPYRWLLWLSVFVILVTSAGALVRPLIMRSAIDGVIKSGDRSALFHGGVLLASVLLVEQVLGLVQMYAVQVAGARAVADMRREVFTFVQGLRLGFFDNQLVGRLVSRVTNDTDASGRHRHFDARARLEAVVDCLCRGTADGDLGGFRAAQYSRSFSGNSRQNLAHERDHE